LLSGCGCILSQIPPQKIYAGDGCSAPLPDYRLKITATDNCEIASYTQTPAPGFLLSATNKVANVTVKATDASGNFRQLVFTVTLLDTIKPVLTVDPDLLAINEEQIGNIYNYADKLLEHSMAFMDKQIADTSVFPESKFPNLRNVYQDSTYFKSTMLTWTAKGHAVTGFGSRVMTFISDKDSINIIRR
jgi:hypothetical protein